MTEQVVKPFPADWAIIIAYRRIYVALGLSNPMADERVVLKMKSLVDLSGDRAPFVATLELARMIEKYEPHLAPVDPVNPDVLAVREILRAAYVGGGEFTTGYADQVVAGVFDEDDWFLAAPTAYRKVIAARG